MIAWPGYRALTFAAALTLAACHAPVRPQREPASVPVALPESTAEPAPSETLPSATAAAEPALDTAEARLDHGAEVFDRLRARLSPPFCESGVHSRTWRQRYAGHPETFARRLEAILPLLAFVLEHIERADLPGEFALIPIVESWYRPEAMGLGGPAGLWQMVSATARHHGVRIERGYDGRLSPIDATEAALHHLKTMQETFGNWRAAAMAYNAGEFRMHRAMRKASGGDISGEHRRPAGLSRTTYDYIVKLEALACLLAEPESQGLTLPRTARFQPLRVVELPAGTTGIEQAARQLGVDPALLQRINPVFRRGQLISGHPRRVLVPATATPLPRQVQSSNEPIDTIAGLAEQPRLHTVRQGDTLSALAQRYRVSLAELLRWNGIKLRAVLRIGQQLRVAD